VGGGGVPVEILPSNFAEFSYSGSHLITTV